MKPVRTILASAIAGGLVIGFFARIFEIDLLASTGLLSVAVVCFTVLGVVATPREAAIPVPSKVLAGPFEQSGNFGGEVQFALGALLVLRRTHRDWKRYPLSSLKSIEILDKRHPDWAWVGSRRLIRLAFDESALVLDVSRGGRFASVDAPEIERWTLISRPQHVPVRERAHWTESTEQFSSATCSQVSHSRR